MKRSTMVTAMLTLALSMGGVHAFAQGRGGGGGKGPGGPPSAPGTTRGPSGTHDPSAHPGSDPITGKRTVSELLTQNTKLASKIHDLTNMDAQNACSEFKNLGQCVAAAHVSKNLHMDFSTLKGKVTGTSAESLGQAIHDMDPNVDAKAEAKKGQKQANEDIKASRSSS